MRTKLTRIGVVFLAFALVFTSFSFGGVSALSKKPTYSVTSSFASSEKQKEEYFKIKTPTKEDDVVYVEGKTKGTTKRLCIRITNQKTKKNYITVFVTPNKNNEFSIKISTKKGTKKKPVVLNKKGTVTSASGSYSTQPGYLAVGKIPAGTYYLNISKATTTADAKVSKNTKWWNGPLGGVEGFCYRGAVLRVKKGDENNLKLVQYKSIQESNLAVRNQYEPGTNTADGFVGSYERYEDPALKDIEFVLKDPKTGKLSSMTKSRLDYVKKTADTITKGAKTDYAKAFKIYEYIAKNYYYDVLAWEESKNQYSNPYLNLYNLKNKKSSGNSVKGKVAMNCQGYGAMVVALCRAEGIPARLVNGRHGDTTQALWEASSLSTLNQTDHWWSEAYIDGRWVFIDACSGNLSKWERKSFGDKGKWRKTNISYAYFDPTDKFVANNFIYHEIYHGSFDGKYANHKQEVEQLQKFFSAMDDYGVTNGQRVNGLYNPDDRGTWDSGNKKFRTDGFGRIDYIDWAGKGLFSEMNLDEFKELKYLMLYNNELTGLSLDGCSNLVNVSATYNNLSTLDVSDSKVLEKLALKGNAMTSVKFRDGSKLITVESNIDEGSFSVDYNKSSSKKMIIEVNEVPYGYKYIGIYNPAGSRVTQAMSYSTSPTKGTYTVKFEKQ